MNKLSVFCAFAGYDSRLMALDRLKQDYPMFDYQCVGWSEIEQSAITAHNALFPDLADKNFGDITMIRWDEVPDFDLFTYSFPCTDISNAGKGMGVKEGSNTRSSLLWECKNAIELKKPKYLLMENVKALTQTKFLPDFNRWQMWLEQHGYVNFWKILNAKDFGVAQNRERVFMVSILKDSDETPIYVFPNEFPLEKNVKGYMEDSCELAPNYWIDQNRITYDVLNNILDQPNVRAEMEQLYHKEWKERWEKGQREVKNPKVEYVKTTVEYFRNWHKAVLHFNNGGKIHIRIKSYAANHDMSLASGIVAQKVAQLGADFVDIANMVSHDYVRARTETNPH
jgi:DNA (cytosine-5)-methyltransferase 1